MDKKDAVTLSGGSLSRTDIPPRLDRLPWSRFHTRICVVLGFTWALVGLVVTLVGPLDPAIRRALSVPENPIDLIAFIYLAGMVLGAFLFGWAIDRFGRRQSVFLTVLVYLLGTIATGYAWNLWSFAFFRFVTGAGIGGAYVAVNSVLQELIPAHYRGTAIISVNGVFWAGAMCSALASLIVLNPAVSDPKTDWRAAFVAAGIIAFLIVPFLTLIPESPRWLISRGRPDEEAEANRIVTSIEAKIEREHRTPLCPVKVIQLFHLDRSTLIGVVHRMFSTDRNRNRTDRNRNRAVLGLILMASQAFLYNSVFFDYARHLQEFYHVPDRDIGRYMLPIAFGNLVGALVLSRLFDSAGRERMITITYVLSGVLVAITGFLFWLGWLDAYWHTACWIAIFFVASAAASSAYLTIGEAFPLEMRAMSIALLFASGTAIGGVALPILFDWLVPTGALSTRYYSFAFFAAVLMITAGGTEWHLGFSAARKSSEEVTKVKI